MADRFTPPPEDDKVARSDRSNRSTGSLHKVLYIDDETDLHELVRLALEDVGGLEVLTCGSGAEGLNAVVGFRPDLILLDVMMPGMDGPATFQNLRQMDVAAKTPIVFITAKSQAMDLHVLGTLDTAGLIKKPFQPMTLHEEIKAIWDGLKRETANSKNRAPDPRLAALGVRYQKSLRENYPVFQQLAREALAGSIDASRDLQDRATSLAHQIAGSAGTFGHGELGDCGLMLEEELIRFRSSGGRESFPHASLGALVTAIQDVLHQD